MKNRKNFFAKMILTLPTGVPQHICIGMHWTAVVMDVEGSLRCGLASTLDNEGHHGVSSVPQAGTLEDQTSLDLTNLTLSDRPTLVSVGVAAVNALLPPYESWIDLNAEDVIASNGQGQSVALIGHFPFVERLSTKVGKLTVLELNPQPGDLDATSAKDVLPDAQVVAITGMSLLNHTFESLLQYCSPDALIILLGPSVPLSPMFFNLGVDILCGSIVTSIDPVLSAVRQGANFRQIHRAGVRLVAMTKPELSL